MLVCLDRHPFGTYHGALTIARSILFWNLCNISILDVLADPP
jgi:hypothetical protein